MCQILLNMYGDPRTPSLRHIAENWCHLTLGAAIFKDCHKSVSFSLQKYVHVNSRAYAAILTAKKEDWLHSAPTTTAWLWLGRFWTTFMLKMAFSSLTPKSNALRSNLHCTMGRISTVNNSGFLSSESIANEAASEDIPLWIVEPYISFRSIELPSKLGGRGRKNEQLKSSDRLRSRVHDSHKQSGEHSRGIYC